MTDEQWVRTVRQTLMVLPTSVSDWTDGLLLRAPKDVLWREEVVCFVQGVLSGEREWPRRSRLLDRGRAEVTSAKGRLETLKQDSELFLVDTRGRRRSLSGC